MVPELIFGVSMFFVFTTLFAAVHLGTLAEVLGLVTTPARRGGDMITELWILTEIKRAISMRNFR